MIKSESMMLSEKQIEWAAYAERVRRATDGIVIDQANRREINEFIEGVQRETERIVKTRNAISLFLAFAHYLKNKDIWPTT